MKKALVLYLISFIYLNVEAAAITYESNDGARFGDHLLCYSHVKWIAYKHKIPLLYKPFLYSDQLLLHRAHRLSAKDIKHFAKVIRLKNPKELAQIKRNRNILYILPRFYPEIENAHQWSTFDIQWDDFNFLAELKNEIKPRRTLNLVSIPSGYIAIAAHIRTGRGYDFSILNTEGPDQSLSHFISGVWNPLRWPPLTYYIQQIQSLFIMLNSQPLYVYIFTDDPDPVSLAKKIEQALQNPLINIGFRKENQQSNNVLEDLFSMAKFDYLIRSESSFSFIAQQLGNFKIVIKPSKYHWYNGRLIIDDVIYEKTKLPKKLSSQS